MNSGYPHQKFSEACRWLVGSGPLRRRLIDCNQHLLLLGVHSHGIPEDMRERFESIMDRMKTVGSLEEHDLDRLSGDIFSFYHDLPYCED